MQLTYPALQRKLQSHAKPWSTLLCFWQSRYTFFPETLEVTAKFGTGRQFFKSSSSRPCFFNKDFTCAGLKSMMEVITEPISVMHSLEINHASRQLSSHDLLADCRTIGSTSAVLTMFSSLICIAVRISIELDQ